MVIDDVRNVTDGIPYFGPIDGSIWHDLKLVIHDYFVSAYLDKTYFGNFSTFFQPSRKAGVLLWNGYQNAAWFQNFELEDY